MVSLVQTIVWLPVFGILNVRTAVDACDCWCTAVDACDCWCTAVDAQLLMHSCWCTAVDAQLLMHSCWCMRLHTGAARTPPKNEHRELTVGEKSRASWTGGSNPRQRCALVFQLGALLAELSPLCRGEWKASCPVGFSSSRGCVSCQSLLLLAELPALRSSVPVLLYVHRDRVDC